MMNLLYLFIIVGIMLVFGIGGIVHDKKLEKRRKENAKYYMELQREKVQKLEKLDKQSEFIKRGINTKTEKQLQNLKKIIKQN